MRTITTAVLLLVSAASSAAPVTIDFEEFNLGDGPASSSSWLTSSGYEFNGASFPGPIPDGNLAEIFIGNSGSRSLGASSGFNGQDGYGATATISMRKLDGGAFAIHSLDLLMQAEGLYPGTTSIAGTLGGGGVADLSVAVGTGDWLNLQLLTFAAEGDNSGFAYLTAVQIDNINVSEVPIPAAVWLFGSALAGVGWLSRKRKV